MICDKPFIRSGPHGTKKIIPLTDEESRLQVTPFPCGSCLPCRIEKSRIWKNRIRLESFLYPQSSFVTLTYNPKHYPPDGSLQPRDLTLYLKKLRKAIYPKKIRYFAVGEYGERQYRPHYHLALFGIGQESFKSIDKSWGKGFTHIGDLNKQSADYIVGYVTKGITNAKSMKWYGLNGLHPEFMRSSRGYPGGIGAGFVKKIAKALKESYYAGSPIYSVKSSGNNLQLGRYLTNKLAEFAGADPEAYNANFWAYQTSIILKHQNASGIYVENVAAEHEGRRISKKNRNEQKKHKRQF